MANSRKQNNNSSNSHLLCKIRYLQRVNFIKKLRTIPRFAHVNCGDSSVVEPLGECGRKVMLWWLRVEARADSKFPPGWIIDPPLDITVPAKRTPWPDAPPELPTTEKVISIEEEHTEKRPTKTRSSRSKHNSRSKRKHEARVTNVQISARHSEEK